MAKKPKDNRKDTRLTTDGGGNSAHGYFSLRGAVLSDNLAGQILRQANKTAARHAEQAGRTVLAAKPDPVILAIRRSFGRYRLELKLTKKPENPLSRD